MSTSINTLKQSQSRKRLYRQKVKCTACGKEIDSDYTNTHRQQKHTGNSTVKFVPILEKNQTQIHFLFANQEKVLKMDTVAETESEQILEPGTSEQEILADERPEDYSTPCSTIGSGAGDAGGPNESSDSDDPADHDIETTTNVESSMTEDGPMQPRLERYAPRKFGKETFERDFQTVWYQKYAWLGYSEQKRMAYCFPCERYRETSFTFSNWKKVHRLKKHSVSEPHKTAMVKWISHCAQKKHKSSVMSQLDSGHQQMVKKNRDYMKIIIECLMFTAQQNIAQRSHNETRSELGAVSDINRGNFLELLHMRCRDIPWLAEGLKDRLDKHSQWTSPAIQNELLDLIAECVLERILSDVRESGIYGIIIDETSDISRKEQVSICLSYVLDGVKKEAFVGFFDTQSTDGKTLYELVKRVMEKMNLELGNIVGECFDGAANMKGIHKGLATLMKETSPLSVYVHCYGHLLNLSIQDTIEGVEPVRNALGTIQSLYNFLEACPKRHSIFTETCVEGDHLRLTLKSLSVTRWTCRWEAVKAILEQLERIVKTLLKLSEDVNPKTYSDARCLLISICDFQFVFGLCVLKVVLSSTSALSRYLQGKSVDVISARDNADLTIQALRTCRTDDGFDCLWSLAEHLSNQIKEWIKDSPRFSFREASAPRSRQVSRRLLSMAGESAEEPLVQRSAADHYRITTYFKTLDKVVTELESRFTGNDQDLLCALGKVVLRDEPEDKYFQLISDHYNLDKDLLSVEHDMFTKFREGKEDLSHLNLVSTMDILKCMHENGLFDFMPNLWMVVKVLSIIPATSCTAERSFSVLRRLKTYLRSTMGQPRLNNLAITSIERVYANLVLQNDIEKIIDSFTSKKGRRSYFF